MLVALDGRLELLANTALLGPRGFLPDTFGHNGLVVRNGRAVHAATVGEKTISGHLFEVGACGWFG